MLLIMTSKLNFSRNYYVLMYLISTYEVRTYYELFVLGENPWPDHTSPMI